MPYDGTGMFTRLYNFVTDRDQGIKILASRVDGEFDNIATAFNTPRPATTLKYSPTETVAQAIARIDANPDSVVRSTLQELRNALPSSVASIYDGSLWTWENGDFTLTANDAYIVKQTATPLTVGAWVRSIDALTPEMFGAVGDGVTNDTDAFDKLNATLLKNNGGYVVGRPGAIYFGGRQVRGDLGYYAVGYSLLKANNLKFFIFDGRGCTFKSAPGLFGAFKGNDQVSYDKTPGQNYNVTLSQRADLSTHIQVYQTGIVKISNVFFDGNGAAHKVGGPWADTGRQCAHYGLYVFNCRVVEIDNCHATEFLLDGFGLGFTGQANTSVATPMLVTNCTVKNVGRNAASQVGGVNNTFINCVFENAGSCDNPSVPGAVEGSPTLTYVNSSPASCFDVEAEGTEIRDPIFIGCSFIAGPRSNTSFVTDSGDSSGHYFSKCTFSGVLWLNKPGIVLEDCKIYGRMGKLYGDGTLLSNQFIRCVFSDGVAFNRPLYPIVAGALFCDGTGAGPGVKMTGCSGYFYRSRLNFRSMVLKDCEFMLAYGTEVVANRDYAVLADAAKMDNVVFTDVLGSNTGNTFPDGEGLFITLPVEAKNNTRIASASGRYNLKWASWSPGGGGYPYAGVIDGVFDTARLTRSKAYDAPSIPAGGKVSTNITIPGLSASYSVIASISASIWPAVLSGSFYSDVNTATVEIGNPTAAAIDLPQVTIFVTSHKTN